MHKRHGYKARRLNLLEVEAFPSQGTTCSAKMRDEGIAKKANARKAFRIVAMAVISVGFSAKLAQAASAINPNDLVVEVEGNGTSALTSAATAYSLEEITTVGSVVQTIAMPIADSGSQHAITDSGTAGSDGLITASANGQYILSTGYDSVPGTTGVTGSTVSRVIAETTVSSGAVDTSTAFASGSSGPFEANNIRGVASADGTNLYAVGAGSTKGGTWYTNLGATTQTQVEISQTSTTATHVANGQLYVGTSTGIYSVGSGTPTTGSQTLTNVVSGDTGTHNTDFYLAPNGLDLYVADTSLGVLKFVAPSVGATFAFAYTVESTGLFGLTASTDGTTVTFYGTTPVVAAGNNSIDTFSDLLATTSATSPETTASVLLSAGTDFDFRGITAVPEPASLGFLGLGVIGLLRRQRRAI